MPPTQYNADAQLFSIVNSVNNIFSLRWGSGNKYRFFDLINGNSWHFVDNMPGMGATAHFAIVYRHSVGVVNFFANGKIVGTVNETITAKNYMLLLGNYRWYSQTTGNTGGIGSVEELRISDCARWTANFDVPTEAYTSDENTLLLMHFGF